MKGLQMIASYWIGTVGPTVNGITLHVLVMSSRLLKDFKLEMTWLNLYFRKDKPSREIYFTFEWLQEREYPLYHL